VACEKIKLQPKQGAPKDAHSLNSGDKNTPPNFNDHVAVTLTVGLQQCSIFGQFSGNEHKDSLAT